MVGHVKVQGWPVTREIQTLVAVAATIPACACLVLLTDHDAVALEAGMLVALLLVPLHEYCHYRAHRWLGHDARMVWAAWPLTSLLAPRTEWRGIARMRDLPLALLAPQAVTLGLVAAAAGLHRVSLWAAVVTYGLLSVGDLTQAAYVCWQLLGKGSRRRILLNTPGPEAGLYAPSARAGGAV